MPPMLDLSSTQARVLGALLEKEMTTPDAYPLTLNALVTACNQTSNRDPVTQHEANAVETAVLALKAKELARVVHPGSGERATKYRHVADDVLQLDGPAKALLCVLMLRGAQTTSELRSRTERLFPFTSPGHVETVLDVLAARSPSLVARVERQAGQKEDRWIQLLEIGAAERAATAPTASTAARGPGRVEELEERLAALEARVARLEGAG